MSLTSALVAHVYSNVKFKFMKIHDLKLYDISKYRHLSTILYP